LSDFLINILLFQSLRGKGFTPAMARFIRSKRKSLPNRVPNPTTEPKPHSFIVVFQVEATPLFTVTASH